MTNITLSIENSVYKEMKEHSEIKWSEYVRKMIKNYLEKLKKVGNLANESVLAMLASEKTLAKDWLSKEDEEAWKDL